MESKGDSKQARIGTDGVKESWGRSSLPTYTWKLYWLILTPLKRKKRGNR